MVPEQNSSDTPHSISVKLDALATKDSQYQYPNYSEWIKLAISRGGTAWKIRKKWQK